jgi:inner membrane protein
VDSITQAALGAAVAEAGMGRRLGNKAIVWGVALGTLPDLDVVFNLWLDHIQELELHRGWSHSLLVIAIASPFFGWLIASLHKGGVHRFRHFIHPCAH